MSFEQSGCFHRSGSGCGGGASLSNTAPLASGTPSAGVGTEASRADHVHPGRTILGAWHGDNLPASTINLLALILGNAQHVRIPVARACKLTAIMAMLSVAAAGSALLVRVSKNGDTPDTTLTLSIGIGASSGSITGNGLTFAAGDTIRIEAVTDGSWTATTSDISAFVELTDV